MSIHAIGEILNKSKDRLESLKSMLGESHGFTAGWGLAPKEYRTLPWNGLKQTRREIQSDRVCSNRYPGIDTSRYFCVGNVRKERYVYKAMFYYNQLAWKVF